MTDHSENCSRRGTKIDKARVRAIAFCQSRRRQDRAHTLKEIDSKHWIAKPLAQSPRDIGRADISATEFANIDASQSSTEVTRRERSQKIGDCRNYSQGEPHDSGALDTVVMA